MDKEKSNACKVKEFTEGYTNTVCPDKPKELDKDNVLFIIRMVFSELDELAATVTNNKEEKIKLLMEAVNTRDNCDNYIDKYPTNIALIGAQADAMVDAWYYMLNIAAKHGINLSKLFDIVHQANMNKRDPATGKFLRRPSDGKVIKPAGWTPPDIDKAIQEQFENGSWN